MPMVRRKSYAYGSHCNATHRPEMGGCKALRQGLMAGGAKWSASHAATVLTRIESHLLHGVGARSLADLKSIPLLLRPLKAAEAAREPEPELELESELAGRLRQYINGIMKLAVLVVAGRFLAYVALVDQALDIGLNDVAP